MSFRPSRREVLAGAAAGLVTAVPNIALASAPAPKRALRVAHLTDIHVTTNLNAGPGMHACLKHVNDLKDKPQLMITGGDMIMDALKVSKNSAAEQWNLFTQTLGDASNIPVHHCIGNHDIWGWQATPEVAPPGDRDYGKAWAVDLLQMPKPYYSFDKNGWHFVVLDTVHQREGFGYIGWIDPAQMEWLEKDLAAVPAKTPTMVVSHIPLLSMTPFLATGDKEIEKNFQCSISEMVCNSRRVVNLLSKYPTVKLALSGHIHLNDTVVYNGVTYVCAGAVSGAWWLGNRFETKPGYSVVDLYADGSFQQQYIPWGWKPAQATPKAEVQSWEEAMAFAGAR